MVDPLKERLDKLKKFSDSAKRRANLYSEVSGMDDGHILLVHWGLCKKHLHLGKKLQKIGFLMLWVPEPTGVTCAIGGPMIVAGTIFGQKIQ